MKEFLLILSVIVFLLIGPARISIAQTPPLSSDPNPGSPSQTLPCFDPTDPATAYAVGVDDVLEISVLKPEKIANIVTVTPDGSIDFPYVGSVPVKGRTVAQVQEDLVARLANGYMKYPIVSVVLKESKSRKFFVYGEVLKPGSYPMEDNMTVLRAISMAGGFSRFGSSSGVKVLRPKKGGGGYEPVKVNMKAVMWGSTNEDLSLTQGDIVVVTEGAF